MRSLETLLLKRPADMIGEVESFRTVTEREGQKSQAASLAQMFAVEGSLGLEALQRRIEREGISPLEADEIDAALNFGAVIFGPSVAAVEFAKRRQQFDGVEYFREIESLLLYTGIKGWQTVEPSGEIEILKSEPTHALRGLYKADPTYALAFTENFESLLPPTMRRFLRVPNPATAMQPPIIPIRSFLPVFRDWVTFVMAA